MRDVTQWVSRARVLGVQQREESRLQLYHAVLLSLTTRPAESVGFPASAPRSRPAKAGAGATLPKRRRIGSGRALERAAPIRPKEQRGAPAPAIGFTRKGSRAGRRTIGIAYADA